MPILPKEPCLFPNDLFSLPLGDEAASSQWWALYTKPRAEKSLVRSLHGRQVPYFLPLYEHSWRQRGRKHTAFVPLFPGYVFLHGDEEARLAALETNMVVHVLQVPDQDQLHDDLSRVHRLLTGELPLSPENGFQPGTKVEIVAGPFQGIHGKLLRSGAKTRLVVEVEFLRQGVSVEVEGWMVRRLEEECPAAEPVLAGGV